MCSPAFVMMGISAVASIAQGSQQQDAAEARAREAGYQAEQNRADAQAEEGAAEVRANRQRKMGALVKSQARSSLAKSGVVADAGSALKIQDYIASSSEEDALTEIISGKYKADKIRVGAATLDREAMYERRAGDNAMTSGFLNAGMTAGKSLLGIYGSKPAVKSGWQVQVDE